MAVYPACEHLYHTIRIIVNISISLVSLGSARLHSKYVEVPGGVIDVEPGTRQLAAVAIVNLRAHEIGKAHLLTAKLGKGQLQPALPLISGIIDDDNVSAALGALPAIGDEIVMGPVTGPSRQWLDLRPPAVTKRGPLQYSQQLGIKFGNFPVFRLGRAAAQMGRHTDACAVELTLVEEAQAG